MKPFTHTFKSVTLGLAIALAGSIIPPVAYADRDRSWEQSRDKKHTRYEDHRSKPGHPGKSRSPRHYDHDARHHRSYDRHARRHYYPSRPAYPHRHYTRYQYVYPDFYKYFAFTAITLKILDILNEDQRRKHETALSRAMDARVGESITWHDRDASGVIMPTRSGVDAAGQPCREFQQTVTIGGKTEQAYGTACRQADGSWLLVP